MAADIPLSLSQHPLQRVLSPYLSLNVVTASVHKLYTVSNTGVITPTSTHSLFRIDIEVITHDIQHCTNPNNLADGVPVELSQVLCHISERISQLHARSYVHRDLKPGNILWQESTKSWVLIDFGLARKVGSTARAAMTPSYAAPETVSAYKEGRLVTIHPSVDVYALGVIAFELLTRYSPALSRSEVCTSNFAALCISAGEWCTWRQKGTVLQALEKLADEQSQLPWEGYNMTADVEFRLGKYKSAIISLLQRNPSDRPSITTFIKACEKLAVGRQPRTIAANEPWYFKWSHTLFRTASPMGRTLKGHEGWVNAISWSPNGATVATGSSDGKIILWDASRAIKSRILERHTDRVLSVVWSPNGVLLATASMDAAVILWDVATGASVHILVGHKSTIVSAAWSPNGAMLASASHDGTAILWDVATGEIARALREHTDMVVSVAWRKDGRTVATASSDKTVILWDVVTGKKVRTLRGHSDWVLGAAWSPDGDLLASTSNDDSLLVWNVATGECYRKFTSRMGAGGAVWSGDGASIAAVSSENCVVLLDVTSGKVVHKLTGHSDSVLNIAWSPDGLSLATASYDESVIVWDVTTGKARRLFEGHSAWVIKVAWSPSGEFLTSGSMDGTAIIWNVTS